MQPYTDRGSDFCIAAVFHRPNGTVAASRIGCIHPAVRGSKIKAHIELLGTLIALALDAVGVQPRHIIIRPFRNAPDFDKTWKSSL